jgi:translation initiation factor IF-3
LYRLKDIKKIRLINGEGQQLGVYTIKEALDEAKANDLDIVLISKDVDPAICKMVDFGKYKYDEDKKQKNSKHHAQELKEVKISPNTAIHDLNVTLKKVNKFLSQGDKVKITCFFKVREMVHPKIGLEKIQYLLENIAVNYHVDKEPIEEKSMHTILSPTNK